VKIVDTDVLVQRLYSYFDGSHDEHLSNEQRGLSDHRADAVLASGAQVGI
jgi:hypothetical protein